MTVTTGSLLEWLILGLLALAGITISAVMTVQDRRSEQKARDFDADADHAVQVANSGRSS